MISGTITRELDAIVSIILLDAEGSRPALDFVVDTGFSGAMSMPVSWIKAMNYPWSRSTTSILADGSVIDVDVYEGRILWDNKERAVPIDATEGDLLIGMELLQGFELRIQVVVDGLVTIAPLLQSEN